MINAYTDGVASLCGRRFIISRTCTLVLLWARITINELRKLNKIARVRVANRANTQRIILSKLATITGYTEGGKLRNVEDLNKKCVGFQRFLAIY